jgi:hypothetical protein
MDRAISNDGEIICAKTAHHKDKGVWPTTRMLIFNLSDVLDLSNVEANDTARVIQLKVEIRAEVAPFV